MTFIAGFETSNGLLLCADSEYSGAGTKKHGQKLFPHIFAGGAVLFALSGADSGRAAIEMCKDALSRRRSKAYSEKSVRTILRDTIRAAYTNYVDSRPTEMEREEARFDLLIGIAMRGSPSYLMANSGPVVTNVDGGQACRGSGWWAGGLAIANAWRSDMATSECVICALRALNMAKRHGEGVGGYSQFLSIQDGVLSDIVPHDPTKAEELITEYEEVSNKLLLKIGNHELGADDFERIALNFANAVIDTHARWLKESTEMRELLKFLGSPSEG